MPARERGQAATPDVAAARVGAQALTPTQLARGNQFVQRLLVQREGEEGDEKEAPKKPEKTMIDKARAVEVLKKSYKDYKTIAAGKVEVYAQADFQKAYDKIYGETKYAWDKYVVPKFGNLEGFAHKGTNYINKDIGSVDVVPHEMLHNNDHSSWTPFAGSETNEGTTEYLTIKAVEAEGYTASHSYPSQEGVVQELVAIVGEDKLMAAYFKGKTADLNAAMEDACKGTWAEFKAAMQAQEWAKAKKKLEKK